MWSERPSMKSKLHYIPLQRLDSSMDLSMVYLIYLSWRFVRCIVRKRLFIRIQPHHP